MNMTQEIQDLFETLSSIKRSYEKVTLMLTYTGFVIYITEQFTPLGYLEFYVKSEKGTINIILLHISCPTLSPANFNSFLRYVEKAKELTKEKE